ncbi:hypothetical protein [Streptosporangium carneum]|uniref:Uncharacterized protein n=1 Tax=Streptosporangium carneum TaxID=47481 RepID=A0A9W6MI45_9ACTN|nr:hypothetical protein [Streptosporangium carneum]GLK14875.1 hypothetical protein GCM10017600_82880 [Streptosporangium carneum]
MYVSDAVWAALDPAAGEISARTSRRILAALAVAAALVLGAAQAWDAGLVLPRLADPEDGLVEPGGWATKHGKPPEFAYELRFTNHGVREVVLLGAGRSGPGLALRAVQAGKSMMWPDADTLERSHSTDFPYVVAPGASAELRLLYVVTDCAAVPFDSWPIPVRAMQWWGETAVDLRPAPQAFGPYRSREGESPRSPEWQKYMADYVCSPPEGNP